ncbi:hypothetical protein Tco_1211079 [Tanacetum coccineum]
MRGRQKFRKASKKSSFLDHGGQGDWEIAGETARKTVVFIPRNLSSIWSHERTLVHCPLPKEACGYQKIPGFDDTLNVRKVPSESSLDKERSQAYFEEQEITIPKLEFRVGGKKLKMASLDNAEHEIGNAKHSSIPGNSQGIKELAGGLQVFWVAGAGAGAKLGSSCLKSHASDNILKLIKPMAFSSKLLPQFQEYGLRPRTLGGCLEQLSHKFDVSALGSTVGFFLTNGYSIRKGSITTGGPSGGGGRCSRD